MEKRQITPAGYKKLKEELEYLDKTRRKEIADRLERAVSFGDLSENADYEEAKEEQRMLEEKVQELKQRLANVEVVEHTGGGTVQLGSTVTLKRNGETITYELVSPEEADPSNARVSSESPIGEALLGKHEGDTVNVDLPAGTTTYEIAEVS